MTSKIKVDNINKVSDDSNIINKCGTTVTVGAASDGVRTGADNLQAADGGNLISQSGTTITLGASGDTVTLAAGASQTGFGREGSVDWQTSSIKTATFTATSGEGYFCNTTAGGFTINLPASPSAGDIVAFQDYAGTWASDNLTVGRNGSNIGGLAGDVVLSSRNQSFTLVYVDGTRGWQTVNNSTENIDGASYVTATGGSITTCGNYKIHTFTGPGTFQVSCAGNPTGSYQVDYMVTAGGGSGGVSEGGGGGGAGGFRESAGTASGCYTASPLGACVAAIAVSATAYPIAVGGGGATNAGSGPAGNPGNPSTFSTITSTGGGPGARFRTANDPESVGGSGGGGTGRRGPGCSPNPGGAGNTPPVSPPQGNPGGAANTPAPTSSNDAGGGGGGATASGGDSGYNTGQPGGAGATTSINGTPTAYAGGGGGGSQASTAGCGGAGGGGAGYAGSSGGAAGTDNTGGGGGGGGLGPTTGQAGGSGIVIIRYKYQ